MMPLLPNSRKARPQDRAQEYAPPASSAPGALPDKYVAGQQERILPRQYITVAEVPRLLAETSAVSSHQRDRHIPCSAAAFSRRWTAVAWTGPLGRMLYVPQRTESLSAVLNSDSMQTNHRARLMSRFIIFLSFRLPYLRTGGYGLIRAGYYAAVRRQVPLYRHHAVPGL